MDKLEGLRSTITYNIVAAMLCGYLFGVLVTLLDNIWMN